MKHLNKLAVLTAVITLGLAGCATEQPGSVDTTPEVDSPATYTIRVANLPAGLGAAIPLGIEGGQYSDSNIEVENNIFSAATDAIDAVLGGQADVAVASTFDAITRLQSDRIVILASLTVSPPGWHRFAVSDELDDEPASLSGKKIGFVAGTSEQWVTDEHVATLGLEGEVTKVSFTSLFDLVTALQTGDVDAGWIWGDGVEQIDKSAGVSVRYDDTGVYPGTNALLVTTRDYAAKNVDLLAKFLTAIEEVNLTIKDDIEGNAATVASAIGGTDTSLIRAFTLNEYQVRLSKQDLDTINSLGAWAVASGSFTIPNDISTYLDTSALSQAFPDRVPAS